MESKSNSKSNQWTNKYESYVFTFESFGEWFDKTYKFDNLTKLAEIHGKVLEYNTYICEDGWIMVNVICQ